MLGRLKIVDARAQHEWFLHFVNCNRIWMNEFVRQMCAAATATATVSVDAVIANFSIAPDWMKRLIYAWHSTLSALDIIFVSIKINARNNFLSASPPQNDESLHLPFACWIRPSSKWKRAAQQTRSQTLNALWACWYSYSWMLSFHFHFFVCRLTENENLLASVYCLYNNQQRAFELRKTTKST